MARANGFEKNLVEQLLTAANKNPLRHGPRCVDACGLPQLMRSARALAWLAIIVNGCGHVAASSGQSDPRKVGCMSAVVHARLIG